MSVQFSVPLFGCFGSTLQIGAWHTMGTQNIFFIHFLVFSTACLKLNHMEIIGFDSLLIVKNIYLISPITGRFLQGMKHNKYFAK